QTTTISRTPPCMTQHTTCDRDGRPGTSARSSTANQGESRRPRRSSGSPAVLKSGLPCLALSTDPVHREPRVVISGERVEGSAAVLIRMDLDIVSRIQLDEG